MKVSGQDNYYHLQNVKLRGLLKLDNSAQLSQYSPVGADVIGRDPQAWYDSIEVDQGSGSGVAQWDPVIGPGGLVGDVTHVGPSYSIVTLLTAPQFAVGAMVEGPRLGPDTDGDAGTLKPAIGNPNTLVLNYLSTNAQLGTGQVQVVTSGFKDMQPSLNRVMAPPGIPIGTTPGGSAQQTSIVTNGEGQRDSVGRSVEPEQRPDPHDSASVWLVRREFSIQLPLRIALVAFLAVVIQETTISQISVFGVAADITPIVVMSIGLLCGSMAGAIAGFAIGLFVDLALFQTLGITSLLYIAIGYWCGRLRELRAPSHGLMPLLLGAIATAFTGSA